MIAVATAIEIIGSIGPLVALLGVAGTLAVGGARAERQHRRELYARSLDAVSAYYEMPFAISRRRHEPEHRSAERVRLTEQFSRVQAELTTCIALLRAEGDSRMSDLYEELVRETRRVAGEQAREAWLAEPITADEQVNMPDLRAALRPIDARLQDFAEAVREAGRYLWQWQRPVEYQSPRRFY